MSDLRISGDLAARYRKLLEQPVAGPAVKIHVDPTAAVPPRQQTPPAVADTTPADQDAAAISDATTRQLLVNQASSDEPSAAETMLRLKQAIFTALDANGDGTLTRDEVAQMFAAAGSPAAYADATFNQMNPQNRDSLTMDQYLQDTDSSTAPTPDPTSGPTSDPGPTPAAPPATAKDAMNALVGNIQAAADPSAHLAEKMFQQVDTDGDGAISASDLEQAVVAAGGSPESADFLYAQLDPDGTGSVSAAQFASNLQFSQVIPDGLGGTILLPAADAVTALAQKVSAPVAPAAAAYDPFSAVDVDNDGAVTHSEVAQAVAMSGGTTDAADALYAALDPDNTGAVSENQFYANMPMPETYTDPLSGMRFDLGPVTDAQSGMNAVYETMAASADPLVRFSDDLFSKLDTDRDGTLSQTEIEQGVTAAGGSTAAADALFNQVSATGAVTARQFTANAPRPALSSQEATLLSDVMRARSGSGYQLAQSTLPRAAASLSTPMMSVLLQAQSRA